MDVDGVSVSPDHFINGERVASPRTFEDRTPLDWTWKLADVARGSALEADLAVSAARDAFPAWSALSTADRGVYLDRLAELIDRDVEKIAHVECLDMAVSYTHLDVYKRQGLDQDRGEWAERTLPLELHQRNEEAPRCLLYTSRCV